MSLDMLIELESGFSVYLESILILDPYNSLLEGSPSERVNEAMMRAHMATFRQVFGPKPVHIMEPATFTNPRQQLQLFPVLVAASCWSSTPVKDASMHGSKLIIVQFHKEFSFNVLFEFVSRLKAVRWREYASDFMW
jgi:hypothetical protein